LGEYLYTETRYRMLQQSDPVAAAELLTQAQQDVRARWDRYAHTASVSPNSSSRNGVEKAGASLVGAAGASDGKSESIAKNDAEKAGASHA
jgi:hypothetical protein